MKTKPTPARAIIGSALLILTSAATQAQTTYTYIGTGDNNNASRWQVTTNWDTDPNRPGTGFEGAADDIVIIRNQLPDGSEQEVRLTSNAGTIGDITVGGQINGTGDDTELQLRGGGSLVVAGLMQIGDTFAATDGGRIEQVNNPNVSTLTLNDVVAGSTDGNNRLLTNSIGAVLNIGGDIDTAAVRSGLDGMDAHLIDLQINRGTLNLTGGTAILPQTLNVQDFNLGENNTAGATATATIGLYQTINTSAQADVSRQPATTQSDRDMTATLYIHGGTMNVAADLVLASQTAGSGSDNTSDGFIEVGGAGNPGTLTVGDELRLAPMAEADGAATATFTVDVAGSSVTVANGIEFASQQNQPFSSATITINDGTMTVTGPIQDHDPIFVGDLTTNPNNSTLVISGGELVLLNSLTPDRDADKLTHSTGTIDFLVYDGMPPISCTDADLGDGTPGSAVYDITTPSDGIFSTAETATWDNGGGDSDWDTGANWAVNDLIPAEAAGVVANGAMFPLVSSSNAITANGGAAVVGNEAVIGNSDGGWTLQQNASDITVTRTGASFGSGVAKALIDTAVTVNRGSDLNVQPAAGQGADASQLDISDGTLNVTGNLILGGTADGTVNQAGGAVNVTSDLIFGGSGATQGGIYNLDGGTLTVSGEIIEGASGAPDAAVDGAQLHIDGGTLTVGGTITVQRFAVGEKTGTTGNYTASGANITTTGEFTVGELGNGTLDLTNSTVVVGTGNYHADQTDSVGSITLRGTSSMTSSSGELRVSNLGTGSLTLEDGASVTHTGGNFELAEGATGNGTLTMNTTGTLTLNSNNFKLGQTDGSEVFLNLTAGTIDLLPSGASSANGNMNANGGEATVTMTGGTIKLGEDLLGSQTADGVLRWNQSGGEVLINDAIDSRPNGDDRIDLSGNAVVKLGQEAGRDGNLAINDTSSAGTGGNWLILRGSNVTLEVIDGATSNLIADTDATIHWEFDDTGISTIKVGGTVTLNDATANITHVGTTPPSTGTHVLIDNQGFGVVIGEFAGLGEGATFTIGSQVYQISYIGSAPGDLDFNDVVVTPVFDPVVTIAADGDVVEGDPAGWTLTATPPPVGEDIIVDIIYEGTAVDGSDFTGVTQVTILDGQPTADLDVPTTDDGIFEGCETIIAIIDFVDGAGADYGSPDSAQLTLVDGNSQPTATNLEQVSVGTGTVELNDIVVSEPDASYESMVDTASVPLFLSNGLANLSTFSDGRPDDDGSFDLDAAGPALSEAAGMSLNLDFIPQAADLAGTVMVFEIGGTSNGSSIVLVDGYPHLLSKANGVAGNEPTDDMSDPNVFTDLDWVTDNNIVIPLSGTPLVAGLPARIAVVYDIIGDTVKYSVNGTAEGTVSLINRDGTNWRGDHTINIGLIAGGVGGTNNGTGTFGDTIITSLSGTFGAVSCTSFWNESTGAISATAGTAEVVGATLSIDGWAADKGGLTAASGNGEIYDGAGGWSVTGNVAVVNAALAAAAFVEGTATTYPFTISISIDDGGTPITGTIYVTDTQPGPYYVDDDFSGNFLDPITDGDLGEPGDQNATFGVDAFSTLTDALAVVDPAGTIIVNDGDYFLEEIAMLNSETLQLTNTVGGVTIGSLAASETNSIDLQGNTLTLGNDALQDTIACGITGSGNLVKDGADRLVLQEVCTYTGTTTVNDGFLRVGHFDVVRQAALDGDGPVVVNYPAVLEFNVRVDKLIHQTGEISGDGLVLLMADGTLVFDGPGANTFTGGIQLGDSGASSWNGTVGSKNGFVVIGHNNHLGDPSVPIDWRGHQLQASAPGIVVPNDILVGNGGFRFGGSNSIEMAGDIIDFDVSRGTGNYGPDDGTTVTLSGTINLQDAFAVAVNLTIDGNDGTDNRDIVFSGPITGPGSIVLGGTFDDGTLTVSDLTSDFAGTTTINAGTLLQNGAHSGVGFTTVNAGGVLGGTGSTANAVTVAAGGTLAPGASVGTLTTGNLALAGTLEIEVNNTTGVAGTDWDQVIVIGTVDLTGGALEVIEGSVELAPSTIVVIDNDAFDSITGTFPTFSGDYLGSGKTGQVLTFAGDGNDLALLAGGTSIIGNWRNGFFGSPANLSPGANTDNGDGDPSDNLLEFGFGTDPTVSDGGALGWDGGVGTAVPGAPVVNVVAGPVFNAWFMRRSDQGTIGSAGYTLEFSSDLTDWEVDATPPTVLDTVGAYELVQVPFPALLGNGQVPRFFRVIVTSL